MKLTVKEQLEIDLEEQIENSYSFRPAAVGLADVEAGYKPLYPVTVYQVSGDDTSGIAGMLYPDGTFLEVPEQRKVARFWEFDETLKYERVKNDYPNEFNDAVFRVRGNSWTSGEVLWDGSSGPIMPLIEMETEIEGTASQTTKGTSFVKKTHLALVVVHRRLEDTNTLIGDSEALNRGAASARRPGHVHVTFGEDDGGFAGSASHRRAA